MARRPQNPAAVTILRLISLAAVTWSGVEHIYSGTTFESLCAILPSNVETEQATLKKSKLKKLASHNCQVLYSSQYDTNAIGESWRNTAMYIWVDRAGAAAEPAAKLEEELASLKIGGVSGREGRREASRLQRLARQRKKDIAVQSAARNARLAKPLKQVGLALHSRHFDVNAIREAWSSFARTRIEPKEAFETTASLEDKLSSMEIGRRSISEGKRAEARKRRAEKQ